MEASGARNSGPPESDPSQLTKAELVAEVSALRQRLAERESQSSEGRFQAIAATLVPGWD